MPGGYLLSRVDSFECNIRNIYEKVICDCDIGSVEAIKKFYFSSGGHLIKQSGTIKTVLKERIGVKVYEIIFSLC